MIFLFFMKDEFIVKSKKLSFCVLHSLAEFSKFVHCEIMDFIFLHWRYIVEFAYLLMNLQVFLLASEQL